MFTKMVCPAHVLEEEDKYRQRVAEAKKEDKQAQAEDMKKASKLIKSAARRMIEGEPQDLKMPRLPRVRTSKADSAVAKLGPGPMVSYLKHATNPLDDTWRDLSSVLFGSLGFVMALSAFFMPSVASGNRILMKMRLNTWQVALVSFKVSDQ